jgi:hypothetical protein
VFSAYNTKSEHMKDKLYNLFTGFKSQTDAWLLIKCNIRIWWAAVAQWLRCCATNRKVAGLIPDGVTGIFH